LSDDRVQDPDLQTKFSEKNKIPLLAIPPSQKNVTQDTLPTTNATSNYNPNPNQSGCEKTLIKDILSECNISEKNLDVRTDKINSIFELKKPFTERSKRRETPEEGNLLLKDVLYKEIIQDMNDEGTRQDVVYKNEKLNSDEQKLFKVVDNQELIMHNYDPDPQGDSNVMFKHEFYALFTKFKDLANLQSKVTESSLGAKACAQALRKVCQGKLCMSRHTPEA